MNGEPVFTTFTDPRASHLTAVENLARELMGQHGLTDQGWTFQWDSARKRAGICYLPPRKVISLSAELMALWPMDECRDTILHEIAHALTPSDSRHGRQCQAACRQVGARPERCYSADNEAVPPKWTGTCPNGHKIYRERLTAGAKRISCARCSRSYNPDYRFTWTESR